MPAVFRDFFNQEPAQFSAERFHLIFRERSNVGRILYFTQNFIGLIFHGSLPFSA